MKVYGLTGGIASGKSIVAGFLRDLGERVIDADTVARDVVRPGEPAVDEIRGAFGDSAIRDGSVDRARLAEIVFADEGARRRLNAIMHPRIGARFIEMTAKLASSGVARVVYEAPLIVENRLHLGMAGLIVVSVPESVQIVRLIRRDGIDISAARARIASQLPLEEKLRAATWVVDNGGTRDETRAQVVSIVERWR